MNLPTARGGRRGANYVFIDNKINRNTIECPGALSTFSGIVLRRRCLKPKHRCDIDTHFRLIRRGLNGMATSCCCSGSSGRGIHQLICHFRTLSVCCGHFAPFLKLSVGGGHRLGYISKNNVFSGLFIAAVCGGSSPPSRRAARKDCSADAATDASSSSSFSVRVWRGVDI